MNGEKNVLLSYTQRYVPKVRVEVYFPITEEPAYAQYRTWLIDELTELHGGCSVHDDVSGYYFSRSKELIEDRVSVIYSDFNMDWSQPDQQTEVLNYCATLRQFLLDNLSQEEILIAAFPISHVS